MACDRFGSRLDWLARIRLGRWQESSRRYLYFFTSSTICLLIVTYVLLFVARLRRKT